LKDVDDSVLESLLSPEDLKLLAGGASSDTKTSKRRLESVRPSVPWLRKTEYISVTEHKSKEEAAKKFVFSFSILFYFCSLFFFSFLFFSFLF
jgi:hypothetical protein